MARIGEVNRTQVIDLVLAVDSVVQNTYDRTHVQEMVDTCEEAELDIQKRVYGQAIERPEAGLPHEY